MSRRSARRSRAEEVPRTGRESRYKRLKTIGKGSFGVVDLVQGPHNKLYVIKRIVVAKDKMKSAYREVKMLEMVKHPNIVDLVEDFMSDDGTQLCIVMAYCESGDLTAYIKAARNKGKMIPEDQVMEWMVQICMALCHLHDHHILHRDIKPHNVFLTGHGRIVKLGDFGVTKILDNTMAMANTTIGTPYYVSPEICREKPYSYKSDVWALGVLMYELCSLSVPFQAKDFPSLRKEILHSKPIGLSRRYSMKLRKLVGDMISKDPAKRPSIREIMARPYVQHHLRRLIEEHSRPRTPPSMSAGSSSSSSRRRSHRRSEAGAKAAADVAKEAPPSSESKLAPEEPPAPAAGGGAAAPPAAHKQQLKKLEVQLLEEQSDLEARLAAKQGQLARARRQAMEQKMANAVGGARGFGPRKSSAGRGGAAAAAAGGDPAREVETLETEVAAIQTKLVETSLRVHNTAVEADEGEVIEAVVTAATREGLPGLAAADDDDDDDDDDDGGKEAEGAPGGAEGAEAQSFDITMRREEEDVGARGPLGELGRNVVMAVSNGSLGRDSGAAPGAGTGASHAPSSLSPAHAGTGGGSAQEAPSEPGTPVKPPSLKLPQRRQSRGGFSAAPGGTDGPSPGDVGPSPSRIRQPRTSYKVMTSSPHSARTPRQPTSARRAPDVTPRHEPSPSPPTDRTRTRAPRPSMVSRVTSRATGAVTVTRSDASGGTTPRGSPRRRRRSSYRAKATVSPVATPRVSRYGYSNPVSAAREEIRRSESQMRADGPPSMTPRTLASRGQALLADLSPAGRPQSMTPGGDPELLRAPSDFTRGLPTEGLDNIQHYHRAISSREGWRPDESPLPTNRSRLPSRGSTASSSRGGPSPRTYRRRLSSNSTPLAPLDHSPRITPRKTPGRHPRDHSYASGISVTYDGDA